MTGAPAEAARPAGPEDIAQLSRLARRAAEELGAERGGSLAVLGGALTEPLETWFEGHLADAEGVYQLDVGTFDGTVVGFSACRRAVLPDGTTLAVVDALYVEPEARDVGVGEALLGRVLAWSEHYGCAGVDAPALPGMRVAKNFFERAGFVARLLVMHRDTGPDRT